MSARHLFYVIRAVHHPRCAIAGHLAYGDDGAQEGGGDFVMVRIGHRPDRTGGSATIGRRAGREIETVGVAPVPDDQRDQKPAQPGSV